MWVSVLISSCNWWCQCAEHDRCLHTLLTSWKARGWMLLNHLSINFHTSHSGAHHSPADWKSPLKDSAYAPDCSYQILVNYTECHEIAMEQIWILLSRFTEAIANEDAIDFESRSLPLAGYIASHTTTCSAMSSVHYRVLRPTYLHVHVVLIACCISKI